MNGKMMMACVSAGFACGCACIGVGPEKETEEQKSLHSLEEFSRSGIENADKDSRVLSDRNFEYDLGKREGVSFKCKNESATIVDLNNFIWAVCWTGHLRGRTEKLSNEDVDLLEFCVNAQCHVANELAVTALTDILGADYADKIKWQSTEFAELKKNFEKSDISIRKPMREWAELYRGIDPKIVIDVLKFINDGSKGMVIDKKILKSTANISERGAIVGQKWRGFVAVMLPYLEEMRKARAFFDQVRFEKIDDSYTKAAYERIRSESINRYISIMRMLNIVLYDLPFCLETYRAYGKLKDCKWSTWGHMFDDDEGMIEVLRDYSQAISVTDMLSCISTPHAASCYSELIKFFKNEQWERRFKDFVNESKLYKMTPGVDDSGRQSNKLEKW